MPEFLVSHDSALPAWGQIMRDLRRRIEQGQMRSGDRLPTERDLAQRYQVSRMTVRQALDRLERDGSIMRRQGAGTFVTEAAHTLQHDLSLSISWRERAVELGFEARSVEVTTMNDTEIPESLADALGVSLPGPCRMYERLQLVNDTPIGLTKSWVPCNVAVRLPEQLKASSLSLTLRELGIRSAATHNLMEVSTATSSEAPLLKTYVDVPLFIVKAVGCDTAGSVIHVSKTAWLGNRVRFRYDRAQI